MAYAIVVHRVDGSVRTDRVDGGHIAVQQLREDPQDCRALVVASDRLGGRVLRRLHVSHCWSVDVHEEVGGSVPD